MKISQLVFFTIISVGSVAGAPACRLSPDNHAANDTIRVLLAQKPHANLASKPFKLLIKAPITVKTNNLTIEHEEHELTISRTAEGLLHLHELGQTLAAPLTLTSSIDAGIGLQAGPYKRFYKGIITIENSKNGNDTYLINHVPLEDYVYGVVIKEMSPTWHAEAHKAQAVAARSFALYLKATLGPRRQYDIRSSEKDQMYIGESSRWQHVKKEIEPVKNLVLVENGQLSLAMFAACCGSVSPQYATEFNHEKNPYLARSYACTQCEGSIHGKTPVHRWQKKFEKQTLFAILCKHPDSKGMNNAKTLFHISTTHHEPSGRIRTITLHCDNGEYTLPARVLKSLGKESILSYYFTLTQDHTSITLHGKGYGHPIGLCQYGTQKMAQKGASAGQILRYYYPTAEVISL